MHLLGRIFLICLILDMIQFLKELYLTVFALGYKSGIAGGWQRMNRRFGIIMDIGKGVLLVWLIEFFILKGIESYIEIRVGTKFSFDSSLWAKIAISFAIYYANYYVLVTRGHGIKFESEFNNLKKTRKVLLVVSFVVLLLATIALTVCSVSDYQHSFHIIPKSGF